MKMLLGLDASLEFRGSIIPGTLDAKSPKPNFAPRALEAALVGKSCDSRSLSTLETNRAAQYRLGEDLHFRKRQLLSQKGCGARSFTAGPFQTALLGLPGQIWGAQ